MPSAWVIRAGRHGERDSWAVTEGVSGGGWRELPDLTSCASRDDIAAVVESTFPTAAAGRKHNFTGQLYALRFRIQPGDLLAMPLKTTKQIALGRVTAGYTYLADEPEPDRRHVVRVDWIRTDLPRAAVKQDLLFTLGSAMSIFAPSKNGAVRRLEQLLQTGTDPGQSIGSFPKQPDAESDADVDSPELATDIEQVAADQITVRVSEEFAGHDLATLVTAILEAEGFLCVQAPPGPDGGVDISAGRGPLGMDSPRVLVQVKSGSQVGAPVVSQLQGVMSTQGADQGLLVAWGGLSKPARDSLKSQLRIRVWEAADVVEALLRTYDRLPDDIQARLPLKRVWMLAEAGLQ